MNKEFVNELEAKLRKVSESNNETLRNIEDGVKNVKDRFGKLEDRVDSMEKSQNRAGGKTSFSGNTFKDALSEQLHKNDKQLKQLGAGHVRGASFDIKADMLIGTNFTGEVIDNDRLPGVSFNPDRPSHVRQFIPQTTATSNAVTYVVETAYTDGAAAVSEGATKPQSDADFEAKTAAVEVLATTFRISKQMLDDTPFLTSYLNQRGPKKILLQEDNQLLYGDGTSPNLQGITGVAQSYSAVLPNIQNKYDVLVNGITQLQQATNGEYQPNVIMINPADYNEMIIQKGSDNHYLFPAGIRNGNSPARVNGVRVVPITAITDGEFLIGDFNMGATLAMREGINLRFFEQDGSNVTENKITVRIEERLALPITNPDAFVFDTFATAGVS